MRSKGYNPLIPAIIIIILLQTVMVILRVKELMVQQQLVKRCDRIEQKCDTALDNYENVLRYYYNATNDIDEMVTAYIELSRKNGSYQTDKRKEGEK